MELNLKLFFPNAKTALWLGEKSYSKGPFEFTINTSVKRLKKEKYEVFQTLSPFAQLPPYTWVICYSLRPNSFIEEKGEYCVWGEIDGNSMFTLPKTFIIDRNVTNICTYFLNVVNGNPLIFSEQTTCPDYS